MGPGQGQADSNARASQAAVGGRLRGWATLRALAVAIGIAGLSIFVLAYVPRELAHERQRIDHDLAIRADVRASSIERWVEASLADARTIAAFSTTREIWGGTRPPSPAPARHWRENARGVVAAHDYLNAALVWPGGASLLANDAPWSAACLEAALAAIAGVGPPVRMHQGEGATHVTFATVAEGSGGVVVEWDAERWLLPFLAAPPTTAGSSEALLLRQDGADVVFLSRLRGSAAPPLSVRRPIVVPGLAAAVASRGGWTGRFVGTRGLPVRAAVRGVGGTDWGLVVKVDEAEALAPARTRILATGAAAGVIYALLAGATLLVSRLQQASSAAALATARARAGLLLDHANDAVLFIGADGRIREANRRAEQMYGRSREALLSLPALELRPAEARPEGTAALARVYRDGAAIYETVHQRADGTRFPVEVSSRLATGEGQDVVVAVVRDVGDRKQAEDVLVGQKCVLEMVAAGAPLPDTLDRLLGLVEAQSTGMLGSILLLDEDGHVRHAAAPRLPASFTAAIDGEPVGEGRGSCGTAAFRGEAVITEDIETDPLWEGYRPLAAAHGLRACWSTPILDAERRVLGTFALYFRRPARPAERDLSLIDMATHTAAIAIVKHRTEAAIERQGEALRESEGRFRAFMENLPGLANIKDAELRYVYVNPAMAALFGRPSHELIGRRTEELLQGAQVDQNRALDEAVLASREPRTAVLDAGSPGEGSAFVTTKFPLTLSDGGEAVGSIGLDITAQRRAELEVRRLNAELEQRVRERTAKLEAANRELEAFAYSVSHDLKAPLRGIDGYSRLLLEDHSERLDDEGRSFLHNVRQATARMGQLIDDLLAYSRLERRQAQSGRVEVRPLIAGLLADRGQDISARGVAVTVDVPDVVLVSDREGLGLALRNLLENALKFTRAVARPAIEIGGRLTEAACILWVRDNGIGFDMKFHDRIFEVFQRLHRSEDYPGTGVGLAMVRRALERIGGRAWAEAEPGKGAAFFLEIPREP